MGLVEGEMEMFEVYFIIAIAAAFVAVVAFYIIAAVVSDVEAILAEKAVAKAARSVEIVTPIRTVAIPEGMTYEQFDAWLDTAFDKVA